MDYTNLIWAAVALGCGLLIGEIAGRLLRSALGSSSSPSYRENAPRIARLVFWASTAVGLVLAIAVIDDAALDDLGRRLDDNLPSYLIAFLTVIAGYAVSVVVAAMVGQSVAPSSWMYWIFLPMMPPAALISSAAMCNTLETVFSEIAMPPVRELRKPSLMLSPEVSTQLAAGVLLPDVSSPARAPQPASTRATVVPMAPAATSARSRLLVLDISECSVPIGTVTPTSRHGGSCEIHVRGEPSASRTPRPCRRRGAAGRYR